MNDLEAGQSDRNSAMTTRQEELSSLFRAIQEASPEGILAVDGQGFVGTYNQRLLETWRLTADSFEEAANEGRRSRDNSVLRMVAQLTKDPDGFLQRVEALNADPQVRDYCQIDLKDGRTIEGHSVGLFDQNNGYLGRAWFFRDITENKQAELALRNLAWHDPLTGAMNRSHFFERADDELMRAWRYRRPLAIVMLDLDHFKNLNNKYGHAVGDKVLQTVCERWRTSLRTVDLLGRLGGEEFAILMPESDVMAARTAAERLRQAVTHSEIVVADQEIACTVSVGISTVHTDDRSIDDALHRADGALYRAKSQGRNRIDVLP